MRRIALIATLALVLLAVPASALDPGETVLVTQATNGTNASGNDVVNLSADGRCAVFGSNNAGLPQANGSSQIYLRDTEANTTTLISKGVGDAAGDDESRNPVITPDCRYVAWDSEATNLVAPAQTQRLVYRRDLQTGTNVLISQGDGADGVIPNSPGGAFVPRMSADGNVVAFATRATNLSTEDTDTNGNTDVFVRVVSTDHTELVSRTFTGAGITGSQGAGFYTSISADGRYVAFDTEAENLTAEDADSVGDVVVRDRVAGTTTLVSRATGATGAPGDYHSRLPQLSADGSKVAFLSEADNLGSISPPDEETPLHRLNVYVRDMAAGTTVLASRANGAGGAPGDADSGGQPGLAISDDGTKVVFHSQATNLASATRGGAVSIQSFLRNLATNTTQAVAGGAASSQWPVISGDGTHVGLITASGLVFGDTDGQNDIYLHRYVPGSGGTSTPTPGATPAPTAVPSVPPVVGPAAVTLRGDAAFARGTANDLYLACTTLDLYLVDVLPARGRVLVTGAADLRLAGQTADILLDGRKVGSAKIGASGAFAARVTAPARRKRARARYQARVGSAASQKLRLVRRMVATTLTRSGGNLVLRGVVNAPRARTQPSIAVDRFLSCRRREKVKVPNVKPDRRGRFAVRIKVPAGSQAVLYRARTKVPPRAGRKPTKGTFTLPRAADVD